jgi:hypothetical protein
MNNLSSYFTRRSRRLTTVISPVIIALSAAFTPACALYPPPADELKSYLLLQKDWYIMSVDRKGRQPSDLEYPAVYDQNDECSRRYYLRIFRDRRTYTFPIDTFTTAWNTGNVQCGEDSVANIEAYLARLQERKSRPEVLVRLAVLKGEGDATRVAMIRAFDPAHMEDARQYGSRSPNWPASKVGTFKNFQEYRNAVLQLCSESWAEFRTNQRKKNRDH